METVNGCTVIASQDSIETIYFGPAEMAGAYVAIVGVFPPGEPAPPLHLHPHTDEAFTSRREMQRFCWVKVTARSRWQLVASSSYHGVRPIRSGTQGTVPFGGSSSSHRARPSICSFPSRQLVRKLARKSPPANTGPAESLRL